MKLREPLDKPLDAGNGLVCASFGPLGGWLSLGSVHARHGFVELSGLPRFDERWRGDPDAVRRYRRSMTDEATAFLRVVPDRGTCRHDIRVDALRDEPRLVQRHEFEAVAGEAAPSAVRISFRGHLDRPALPEITEVRPPAPTGARTRLEAVGSTLRVLAPELPAEATISVAVDTPVEWRIVGEGQDAAPRAELVVRWPPGRSALELAVESALWVPSVPGPAVVVAAPPVGAAPSTGKPLLHVPSHLVEPLDWMARRSAEYVRSCTALHVTDGERVILTDHRILPLSWTRDAYYQALLLLASVDDDEREADLRRVAEHLRWLWGRAERPDGAWVRSHHANGARKDDRFQSDQQLYPLLELADYWRTTGELPVPPEGRDWRELVAEAWSVVERVSSPETGLVATEENPADDAVLYPYLVSAQILAWYVASRLAELPLAEPGALGLESRAERWRERVASHFVTDGPSGSQWAYAVDGKGGRELLHDANDLPTAFAPLWGFCLPTDPTWAATFRFAFSPANPGYFPGPCGGLGSLHTRAPWPLGDIQGWVGASLAADEAGAAAHLERLVAVATSDGLLPEAYDPVDGSVHARHWFAWPGALLGALYVLDRRRALGTLWHAAR